MSWCTVWKGTPQDCMDHVRGAHDVPWEVKSRSLYRVDGSASSLGGLSQTLSFGGIYGRISV